MKDLIEFEEKLAKLISEAVMDGHHEEEVMSLLSYHENKLGEHGEKYPEKMNVTEQLEVKIPEPSKGGEKIWEQVGKVNYG